MCGHGLLLVAGLLLHHLVHSVRVAVAGAHVTLLLLTHAVVAAAAVHVVATAVVIIVVRRRR